MQKTTEKYQNILLEQQNTVFVRVCSAGVPEELIVE